MSSQRPVHNIEVSMILANDPKFMVGDALIKVINTHTNKEILEKVKQLHPKSTLTRRKLYGRLFRARKKESIRQNQSQTILIQAQTNIRRRNGVLKRHSKQVGDALRATFKAKKDKKALEAVSEDDEPDADEADEDPLGDLEKMSRRELDGTLGCDEKEPKRE